MASLKTLILGTALTGALALTGCGDSKDIFESDNLRVVPITEVPNTIAYKRLNQSSPRDRFNALMEYTICSPAKEEAHGASPKWYMTLTERKIRELGLDPSNYSRGMHKNEKTGLYSVDNLEIK